MKKLMLVFMLFLLVGCNNSSVILEESYNDENSDTKYVTVFSKDGKIVIDTKDVTSKAIFVNYEVDGVIIQFIVVRGTDGVVRIAFNTCQACNPSPKAYFIQKGDYIECQNCGNKFHINKIGIESDGCNPAPVLDKEIDGDNIIIDKTYVDSYKNKFERWNGPVK